MTKYAVRGYYWKDTDCTCVRPCRDRIYVTLERGDVKKWRAQLTLSFYKTLNKLSMLDYNFSSIWMETRKKA